MNEAEVIANHRAAGREFTAAGVQSFVREVGQGDPVVCMHGVPASCFLYRKLLPELGSRGFRGIAFDLPGLGLAARPDDFDYTWTGLGKFAVEAVDALGLERFHLVVHDIGGPVGFELAAAMPERIKSMTVLNTLLEVDGFKKPWSMRPFGVPGLGRVWLSTLVRPAFRRLMAMQGIADIKSVPRSLSRIDENTPPRTIPAASTLQPPSRYPRYHSGSGDADPPRPRPAIRFPLMRDRLLGPN